MASYLRTIVGIVLVLAGLQHIVAPELTWSAGFYPRTATPFAKADLFWVVTVRAFGAFILFTSGLLLHPLLSVLGALALVYLTYFTPTGFIIIPGLVLAVALTAVALESVLRGTNRTHPKTH